MRGEKKLLSICITSYKRIKELERCLNSIDTKFIEDIDIIISEDCSPLQNKIEEFVAKYKKRSKYNIIFNANKRNLGYDKNLEKLISLANSKYILFISDDDYFIQNSLDKIVEYIRITKYKFLYSPFISIDNRLMRKLNKAKYIDKGISGAKFILQDSILFSGLIFEKDIIKDLSANNFVNMNYFQVYLALYVTYIYGAYYIDIPLIKEGGDGENAFGKTTLSNKNQYLADRTSIYSNLEFNKGLIKVIKIFDSKFKTDVIKKYEYILSIGAYKGLIAANQIGKDELKKYWCFLNSLEVNIGFSAHVYYYMLLILGDKITKLILKYPRILFIKWKIYRNE